MLIETLSTRWRKGRVTNTTDSSFPSRVPTATKPTGIGDSAAQTTPSVFDIRATGEYVQNALVMSFFGTGSDNNTFSARLIGWRVVPDPADAGNLHKFLFIPIPLFEVQATLSATQAGVDGTTIPSTMLFADTITLTGTTADQGVSIDIVSPANNTIAHLVVDIKGFEFVEPIFTTGSSATDCNCLMSFI